MSVNRSQSKRQAQPGLVHLSEGTPALEALLGILCHRPRKPLPFPELIGPAWKRLFLVALRRMARRQPALARLCAVEALDLLLSITFTSPRQMSRRGSADLRRLAQRLRTFASRSISPADLKPRPWPSPSELHLAYRQARGGFEKPASKEKLVALWRSWGGYTVPVGPIREALRCEKPIDQALTFVARAHNYTPESLRVIFARHHLSLRTDVFPQPSRQLKRPN